MGEISGFSAARTVCVSLRFCRTAPPIARESRRSSITIVNHYRPGTAEVGTREEYRRHWQQGTAQQLASNFNPEAPATMIEWMRTQLSEVAQ